MSFQSKIQEFAPALFGGRNRPHGREVLTLRPVRHPSVQWELVGDDQFAVLTVQRRTDLLTDLVAKIFRLPSVRKIELTDEISSYVWTCCDGNHSVADIAGDISRRYKLNKRQSEVSVLTFLKTLQAKQLIGVPSDQAKSFRQPNVKRDEKSVLTKVASKEGGYYAARKRSRKSTK